MVIFDRVLEVMQYFFYYVLLIKSEFLKVNLDLRIGDLDLDFLVGEVLKNQRICFKIVIKGIDEFS